MNIKKYTAPVIATATTALMPVVSFALDASAEAAITDAGTSGAGSVTLAAIAVVTVVAAMVGAGIAIALMKRV